jgi:hypothetical protein
VCGERLGIGKSGTGSLLGMVKRDGMGVKKKEKTKLRSKTHYRNKGKKYWIVNF